MKALISTMAGVEVADVAQPTPGPQEILVKVKAIGMNRIDLVALRDPKDQIIGMEWAGEVAEVGSQVEEFKVGDRVMCTGSGGYAQFAVADADRCYRVPDGMAWETASSLLLGLQTMHDALVTQGGLRAGGTVLIQGATSCMGLIGMQLAKALGASCVMGTSRSSLHLPTLHAYACDVPVDTSEAGWPEAVLEATKGGGASIVVDLVSGAATNQCMAAAAIGGRIVNVGRLGGARAEFDFNLHALRRLSYIGVTFRTRSRDEIRVLNANMRRDVDGLLSTINLPVAACFDFDKAADALTFLSSSRQLGKVVLIP